MIDFHGLGPALVTPFTIEGAVDYDSYASLVDRQVSAGVDFLVALATTGETPTLSAEEKVKLLQITKEHSKGLPILVGCGSNSVPATLSNMKLLAPHGVDAWLVVVPFYNKPTQEGQYQYFKTIAQSTDKPVVMYNVPGRTGANMEAQTCLRLAHDVKNIIATKEASGKYEQIQTILEGAPEDFSVLSGDDDMTLSIMKIGAKGVISVASNVVPQKLVEMMQYAKKGDFDSAQAIEQKLKALYKACFVESNPIPAKAALSLLGYCTPQMRLPLIPASEDTFALMKEILSEL